MNENEKYVVRELTRDELWCLIISWVIVNKE